MRRIGHEPLELTPESVHRIHESGGSILGSSRGPQDPAEMVDYLNELGVGILFAIGGDGTLRGAQKIGEEAARRGLQIGVIGVPKTIDNDISFVQRTFGFDTAVTEARRATDAANAEAEVGAQRDRAREAHGPRLRVHRGVFGPGQQPRELLPGSGGAVHPGEVPVGAGASGSSAESHAVIVVAEGAGQDLMAKSQERDASGNVKYGDIGIFLRDAITNHFKQAGTAITLKYIDPSYTIRSVPATAARLGLLPAPRTERGPRRPQRTHEHGRQLLESPVLPTCRSPSRCPSARRSTRRTHSGAVWSPRPVSHGHAHNAVFVHFAHASFVRIHVLSGL